MSGSGISWAICKSASPSRQITMPVPHHSSFLQARCPSCRPTNAVGWAAGRASELMNNVTIFGKSNPPVLHTYMHTLFYFNLHYKSNGINILCFTYFSDKTQLFTYYLFYGIQTKFISDWLHCPHLYGKYVFHNGTTTKWTRSSAIAEGPRDTSCQLKSCQLPRNSAETTYTTSPDQIDGMKLEI